MRISTTPFKRVHLATGILEREDRVLLVASRYPNHPGVLWNLPGGRQRDGELLHQTLSREFLEETGLVVDVGGLRYVSESYDPATATHFLSAAFSVNASGEPCAPKNDAHVSGFEWVARADLATRLKIGVVREPLLAHLTDVERRYFAFADAGVTIEFADEP